MHLMNILFNDINIIKHLINLHKRARFNYRALFIYYLIVYQILYSTISIRPALIAYRIASFTLFTSIFLKIFLRWVFIVWKLKFFSSAISLVVFPLAIYCNTIFSIVVKKDIVFSSSVTCFIDSTILAYNFRSINLLFSIIFFM